MKVSVVIPAAGQGKRMKTEKNKQFLLLDDKEVLAHTVNKFEKASVIDEIIVVAHEDELDYCKNEVVNKYNFNKVTQIISGGATRQESVYNGLQAISSNSDYVVVHDGARPFITTEMITNVTREAKKYDAAAVGVPVKDTIKVINSDNMIINTPDRSKLIAIQTPQVFERELICQAYQEAIADGFVGTDSASLVERINQTVKWVKSSYENIKITTPEDLEFGKRILARRQ